MTRSLRSTASIAATSAFTFALLTASAWAVKPFQDQFYATYLDQANLKAVSGDFAQRVREAKCNLCHVGNDKTQRNTYGIELSKILDHREDKANVDKIRVAFEQVAQLKSDADKADSLTFGELIAEGRLPGREPKPIAPLPTDAARPDEPLRDEFSLDAAVAFLDDAALTWQQERQCFACHSNYALLTTRPLIDWKAAVHQQLRSKLEELGANPRPVSFRVMEGVMAASVLAQNDALTTGNLHPTTRQALDYMWTLQSEDGSFDWEKSAQPPSEVDDHFGATIALIGVGHAPDGYAETPLAQAGLAKIRKYLANTPPVNLHQRSMLLLASLHLDGIMTDSERKNVVTDLFAAQKEDGGWGVVSLGNWKRHDGKPDDTQSSDGYGTGFAIDTLRQAGVPADDPRIQAGVAWLKTNQRASGRWFTRSQWEDSKHYLSRHGTAYAIRALVACGQR